MKVLRTLTMWRDGRFVGSIAQREGETMDNVAKRCVMAWRRGIQGYVDLLVDGQEAWRIDTSFDYEGEAHQVAP